MHIISSTLEVFKNDICCRLQIHVLLTYSLTYLFTAIYAAAAAAATTTTTTVLLLQYTGCAGAANKSNPLPCFVNIATTNRNFYTKIYGALSHSYLHITANLCYVITTFDYVMPFESRQPHVL